MNIGKKTIKVKHYYVLIFDRSLQLLRKLNGGAEEDRTPDLLRARQALSQLSYGPFA